MKRQMRIQFSAVTYSALQENEKFIIGMDQLRKLKQKASAGMVMAPVWWDSQCMIKKDYFEHGQIVTGNTYV